MKKPRKHLAISIRDLAKVLNCKLADVKNMASVYGFEMGQREFIPKRYAIRVLHEMGLDEDTVQWTEKSESGFSADWIPPKYSSEHEAAPFMLPDEENDSDWSFLRTELFEAYLKTLVNSGIQETFLFPISEARESGIEDKTEEMAAACRNQQSLLQARYDELKRTGQLNGDELKRVREALSVRKGHAKGMTTKAGGARSIPPLFFFDDLLAVEKLLSEPLPQFYKRDDGENTARKTVSRVFGNFKFYGLHALQRNIVMSAYLLQEFANAGDEEAAAAIASTVNTLVMELNLFAKIYPNAYQKTARKLDQWPILYSKHNKLAHNPEIIVNNIKLGESHPFIIDTFARWDKSDYLCKVAINFYWHIEKVRQHPEANAHLPYSSAASKLPDIHDENAADAWWPLIKKAFLTRYSQPENEACLDRTITGKTHRTSPGRIRSELLARLESRFKSLFGKFGTEQKALKSRKSRTGNTKPVTCK